MAHTPDLPHFFEENINLEGLFDILSPKNNLVLADDMMLSDADGIICLLYTSTSRTAKRTISPILRAVRSIPTLTVW